MMTRLRVGGIVDTSTVDWYGNISLVVFLSGCNFRCPYCQNSSLISGEVGREMEVEEIRGRIKANIKILDSVVFSGGEPLLQSEGVAEAAKMIRELGLKIMIETNGSIPGNIEKLLRENLLDRIALDVKAPLEPEVYGRTIGRRKLGAIAVHGVRRTLELCGEFGVDVEARTTVVPTISDDPRFIGSIASSIRGLCAAYQLQQFDNIGEILDPTLRNLPPPSREKLIELAEEALRMGVTQVYIKTRERGMEKVE